MAGTVLRTRTKTWLYHGDCAKIIPKLRNIIDLTFLDPPFNQGKDYENHDDLMPEAQYWDMMRTVCSSVRERTRDGGSIYFMQREKNARHVLNALEETGWTFQNMIIWKKMTSAVPMPCRYGKDYQVIVFATKGERPRTFHKLRIDPAPPQITR